MKIVADSERDVLALVEIVGVILASYGNENASWQEGRETMCSDLIATDLLFVTEVFKAIDEKLELQSGLTQLVEDDESLTEVWDALARVA